MKRLLCWLRGGHKKPSRKRIKEIKELIFDLEYDVIGFSAEKNVQHIHELEKEARSCIKCGGGL